jgi:SAM-dependent methyltransferase
LDANAQFPRLVRGFREEILAGAPLPSTRIHAEDHMFRFLLDHHHEHRGMAVLDYLRSGHEAARVLLGVLHHRFGLNLEGLRVLDFAAGFGRVGRHLGTLVPSLDLAAAEMFPRAVAFLRDELGVDSFGSCHEPAAFLPARRFDAVVAASFLSHVPERNFAAWLASLWRLLSDRGLLVFSVLDPGLRRDAPQAHFSYEAGSEIPELPGDSYGVAWASEAFVRRAVEEATGGSTFVQRLPRALWSFQDVYVVSPEPLAPIAPPAAFCGWIEELRWEGAADSLTLCGWGLDLAGPGAVTVALRCGAVTASIPTDLVRGDVCEAYGLSATRKPGWRHTFVAPPGEGFAAETELAIVLESRGVRFPLFFGSIESLDHYLALRTARRTFDSANASAVADVRRLSAELSAARATNAAMAASRFWKLRNAWWALRSRPGG